MIIRQATIDEINQAVGINTVLAAYAAESSIEGMPSINPQIDHYKAMEGAGYLQAFAAYDDDVLVGFLFLLVTLVPHYGVKIATTESYFVLPEYRKSGAGIKLLRQAESYAAEQGAAGFFVSAPLGGKLAQVMEAMPAYRETNRVFFREIGHV